MDPLQFSTNSKVLAYAAGTDRGPAVVVNGKEIALSVVDGILHRSDDAIIQFLLSPDGKKSPSSTYW